MTRMPKCASLVDRRQARQLPRGRGCRTKPIWETACGIADWGIRILRRQDDRAKQDDYDKSPRMGFRPAFLDSYQGPVRLIPTFVVGVKQSQSGEVSSWRCEVLSKRTRGRIVRLQTSNLTLYTCSERAKQTQLRNVQVAPSPPGAIQAEGGWATRGPTQRANKAKLRWDGIPGQRLMLTAGSWAGERSVQTKPIGRRGRRRIRRGDIPCRTKPICGPQDKNLLLLRMFSVDLWLQ
jgi:hypothetical protein